MTDTVAKLYWGNIVGRRHLKVDPATLPRALVAKVQPLAKDLWYIRFKSDPQHDEALHEKLSRYFHMCPVKE